MRPRFPSVPIRPALLGLPVLGLTVLGLAGCAAGPDGAAPATATVPAATATAPAAAKPDPVPEPKPELPLPGLDTLFGARAAHVVAVLGLPALKRLDPPAELWQYRGRDCVLALYLYGDAKAGATPTVTHVEARDADAKRVETARCFRALLREKG